MLYRINSWRTRRKIFGLAPLQRLDRNAKARLMVFAHQLSRRTVKGRHYGDLTAKAVAVLRALLYEFHGERGCFPSYEAIAEKAACARSTVAEALVMLEKAGLIEIVNRLRKIPVEYADLFGRACRRYMMVRTSNAYTVPDTMLALLASLRDGIGWGSKSESRTGTLNPEESSLNKERRRPRLNPKRPPPLTEEDVLDLRQRPEDDLLARRRVQIMAAMAKA